MQCIGVDRFAHSIVNAQISRKETAVSNGLRATGAHPQFTVCKIGMFLCSQ